MTKRLPRASPGSSHCLNGTFIGSVGFLWFNEVFIKSFFSFLHLLTHQESKKMLLCAPWTSRITTHLFIISSTPCFNLRRPVTMHKNWVSKIIQDLLLALHCRWVSLTGPEIIACALILVSEDKQDHLRWRYSTVIHWEQLVYLAIWKDLNKGKIWTKST